MCALLDGTYGPPYITDQWNNLPEFIVNAPSLNSFKHRIDKLWEQIGTMYEPEEDIYARTSLRQNRYETIKGILTNFFLHRILLFNTTLGRNMVFKPTFRNRMHIDRFNINFTCRASEIVL